MRSLRIPILASILLIIVGVFATGWFNLYVRWPILDKVLHGIGGLIAAWFVWELLKNDLAGLKNWRRGLVVISVATLIGVMWEFAEFGSTILRGWSGTLYHYFHGGDLADTLSDLAVDIAGAFVFICARVFGPPKAPGRA